MNHFDFIEYHVSNRDLLHNKIHVHNDSYEILQVIDGNGVFLIGEKPYPLVSNAVYLTKAVQLHCSHANEKSNYVRSKLAVNATYFEKLLDILELSSYIEPLFESKTGQYIPLHAKAAELVDGHFKKMYEISQENTHSANAKLMMTLINILLICKSATVDNDI
jgi:hypothetical protein